MPYDYYQHYRAKIIYRKNSQEISRIDPSQLPKWKDYLLHTQPNQKYGDTLIIPFRGGTMVYYDRIQEKFRCGNTLSYTTKYGHFEIEYKGIKLEELIDSEEESGPQTK